MRRKDEMRYFVDIARRNHGPAFMGDDEITERVPVLQLVGGGKNSSNNGDFLYKVSG